MRSVILLVSILNILMNSAVQAAEVATDEFISVAPSQAVPPRVPDESLALKSRAESAINPYPDIGGINVTDVEANRRGADYDVVAVINKAKDVQTMRVYRYLTTTDVTGKSVRSLYSTKEYKVSTGQEKWVCADVKNANGDFLRREAHWTGTPTGYFNPYLLHADHHSKAYDDVLMSGAVFFNKLGIATHRGVIGAPRLSHGCVRMSDQGSKDMFKYVLQSGGPVSLQDAAFAGQYVDKNNQANSWSGFAQAAIQEGHDTGFGPYDSEPTIPDINQDGTVKTDENGYALRKSGKRALYVVQCVNKQGQDCSSSKIPPKKDCTGSMAPEGQPGLDVSTQPMVLHPSPRAPPAPTQPVKRKGFFEMLFGTPSKQPIEHRLNR